MKVDGIKVGSKVRHNNLICQVVSIDKDSCELMPVGSRTTRYSAPLSAVTVIMNEGTKDDREDSEALFD